MPIKQLLHSKPANSVATSLYSSQQTMWTDLPSDVLAKIFSFLSPDSLACAATACRFWRRLAKTHPSPSRSVWFVALPTRNTASQSCYAHNPTTDTWHSISLDFLPFPVKPIAAVKSLVLFKTTAQDLILCNPFTREFEKLPSPNSPRSNAAIGAVEKPGRHRGFEVYVAGGASEASAYETDLEVFDFAAGAWRVADAAPPELAVRLTVWTRGECVRVGAWLYWITSARVYSLVRCDVDSGAWSTVRVPMGERLEFAALVMREGRVVVVGGTCGGVARVWEFGEGERWDLVGEVPAELAVKFVGEKESWVNAKCVSSEGMICLYGSLGSGMIVWKLVSEGKWEWFWVEGCRFLRGRKLPDLQIKGMFLPPELSASSFFLR